MLVLSCKRGLLARSPRPNGSRFDDLSGRLLASLLPLARLWRETAGMHNSPADILLRVALALQRDLYVRRRYSAPYATRPNWLSR